MRRCPGCMLRLWYEEVVDNDGWCFRCRPAKPDNKDPVDEALDMILRYGGIDGGHHKMWVLDQVVRILTGDNYEQWVRDACDGDEGPDTYGWDEGIPP